MDNKKYKEKVEIQEKIRRVDGAMIYVVVEELIPESQTNKRKELMALFTLIGFSIMMILDVALG